MSAPALADRLASGAQALGVALSPPQQEQLLAYLALIQKWNQVYNLTAVRDPQEMLSHHLLDSLAVIPPLRRHAAGRPLRLLDVGSGAGLPGVVIAICCPDLAVDCVDTVGKKAAFIQQVALLRDRGIHDIILDPGFGFGKTLEHNYRLLDQLDVFQTVLELPVLAGLSRKSMICKALRVSPEAALNGTTALHVVALQKGARILRAHDVREAREVIQVHEIQSEIRKT